MVLAGNYKRDQSSHKVEIFTMGFICKMGRVYPPHYHPQDDLVDN
jgi:hypothetical protein